jgi:hypothetical protein
MSRIDATRPRAIGATGLGASGGGAFAVTRPAGGAFRVEEEAESGAAEAAVPVDDVPSVSLGVMLAAEALDREPPRDQAARRQGHAVLAGLAALQRALLEDGDQAAILDRIAALVADMPIATDPQLAALLGTIVLRARVELALLERSGAPPASAK